MLLYAIWLWLVFCFWWLGTMIACSLQKIKNCISIDNDPLQCNYIKQRINAIQFLPDELQEVGLKKTEFSETLGAKMWKESQPPLGGMFGNEHFGNLAHMKSQWKRTLMSLKKGKLRKLQFWWIIWPIWYCW